MLLRFLVLAQHQVLVRRLVSLDINLDGVIEFVITVVEFQFVLVRRKVGEYKHAVVQVVGRKDAVEGATAVVQAQQGTVDGAQFIVAEHAHVVDRRFP